MSTKYRPWGHLRWLLRMARVSDWDFIGSISTEDRFFSSMLLADDAARLGNVSMVYINHIKDGNPHIDKIQHKMNTSLSSFIHKGWTTDNVFDFDLFSPRHDAVSFIDDFVNRSCGNMILDISTIPKRFFFLFIKRIIFSSKIKNLIVTNTIPLSYTRHTLAENFDNWSALPLFEEPFDSDSHRKLFIGVGHMPMGLSDQVEAVSEDVSVHLFFPFPGTPRSLNLSWKFVFDIENEIGHDQLDIIRVSARDASEVYNHFLNKTKGGTIRSLLAPYGPKPFSLAMSILGAKYNYPVFYTQPRIYHPDYSLGISKVGDDDNVVAYLVKYDGSLLY